MLKRTLSLCIALFMTVSMLSTAAFAQDGAKGSGITIGASGLCKHHTQHDGTCGYTEGIAEIPCGHHHDESCGGLTDPAACNHTHNESCGYAPAVAGTPCGFVCEVCNRAGEPQEQCSCVVLCTVDNRNPDCTVCSVEGADPTACKGQAPAQPVECTCTVLCTGGAANPDCPVCSAEGADLATVCKGAASMLLAPRATHYHAICGAACNGHTDGGRHSESEWTPWDGQAPLTAKGYYYLTKDAVSYVEVPDNTTIYLCLNGHTLELPEGQSVRLGKEFSTFYLCDCQSETVTTYGNIGSDGLWKKSPTPGNCDLAGGVITGGKNHGVIAKSPLDAKNTVTFNMYGGNIAGNTADRGGGVYGFTCTLFICGGSIIGNTAQENGGGVSNTNGEILISDTASIARNRAGDAGGGVHIFSGTLEIGKDCSITGNTANKGGGLYTHGSDFEMSGGSITGNISELGGGVYLYHIGARNPGSITSGSITGNTATNGGGMYINPQSPCSITVSGDSITGNTATNGGGIYVEEGEAFTLNGPGSVTGNEAENGGGIYVNGGAFNTDASAAISSNTANNGGGIYIGCNGSHTIKGSVNGNTAENGGGGVYAAAPDIVINMEKSGGITNNQAYGNGGGVYVASGAGLKIMGAEISGNEVLAGPGGGIYGAGTKYFILEDSGVKNNGATIGGGGIHLYQVTETELKSCTVSDNRTWGALAAVYIGGNRDTKLTLSGTNTITKNQGALYTRDVGRFLLSGKLVITGSATQGQGGKKGIFLDNYDGEGGIIELTGPLDEGSKIETISIHPAGPFISNWNTYMSGKDPKDYFLESGLWGYHLGTDESGNPTLLANSYTVQFNPNGGEGSMASQRFTYNIEQNLQQNAFTRTDYTFVGWNTAADGSGQTYMDEQLVKDLTSEQNGTVTLYAQWSLINYTVKFDANGGEGSMDLQPFSSGTAQNLNPNRFTRTGHTFAGWNTAADGSGQSYTDEQSVKDLTSEQNGTVTLYAQWTANSYTVTLNSNGGTIADGKNVTSYTYGTGAVLPDAGAMSKTGYAFAGWYDNELCSGTAVTEITGTDMGNKTYWAKWGLGIYQVAVAAEPPRSGTVSGSGGYNMNETVTLTATPGSGYRFSHWEVVSGSVTPADTSSAEITFAMPEEDVDVKAVFIRQSSGGSSYRDGEYEFWMNVREKVVDAAPGDTVKVNAGSYDQMSWLVMEALHEAEDVTLHITWNGGEDIIIPSAAALDQDNGRIYYPLSYLEGMDFAEPADQTGAGQTGGTTVEVEAPASDPVGWEPTAPTEGQTQEQPEPEESASQPESEPVSEPETEPGTEPETQPEEETMAQPESGGLPLALILGGGAAVIAAGLGFWFWKRRTSK